MADNTKNETADADIKEEPKEESEEKDDDEESKSEDDESEEDDKMDEENERRILELVQQVDENPYLYDAHAEIIKLLREIGELDKLREAREKMSELFPLTEELWLDWIRDEIPLAVSEDERHKIVQLFERAVKDYLSVNVWLEYVQYEIGGIGQKDGVVKIRETFERALTAVGLHTTSGANIWEAFREFENAILAGLMPKAGEVPTAQQAEDFKLQTQRITSLFRRQLSVPLFDMEDTYSEMKEWLQDDVDTYTNQAYKKALEKLKKIKPYEDKLLTAEPTRLEEFQSYIKYELSEGDPTRIQLIFERAIQENCLNAELWLWYTKYLDTKLKVQSVVTTTYERSVRNCPWCAQLWKNYILSQERFEEPLEKVKEIIDKALSVGFASGVDYLMVWSTFCDYLRRRIKWDEDHEDSLEKFRGNLEKAVQHLSYFPDADPNGGLRQYWATIEAKYCKNLEKARELWNEIMTEGHGNEAAMWLEFYRFERTYGNNKHCRKVLQRAMNSVSDWPESIVDAWIEFERIEGTLEQYDFAVSRCEAQMERIQERKDKAGEKEAEFQEQKKHGKTDKKSHKKVKFPDSSKQKHNQDKHPPKFQRGQQHQQNKKQQPKYQKGQTQGKSRQQNNEEQQQPARYKRQTQQQNGVEQQQPPRYKRQSPQQNDEEEQQPPRYKRQRQGVNYVEKVQTEEDMETDTKDSGRSKKRPPKYDGKYKRYSYTQVTAAFNDVKLNNMSVCGAAKKHNIPEQTLRDRVRGKIDISVSTSGKSPTFTSDEESKLVSHLERLVNYGYGYIRQDIVEIATDYALHLGKRTPDTPFTSKWYEQLVKRWPKMKAIQQKSFKFLKAHCTSQEIVKAYFNKLEEILDQHNLKDKPHLILNVDEKCISELSRSSRHSQPQSITGDKTATIIGCGSASGVAMPPYIVLAGKRFRPDLLNSAFPRAGVGMSETGCSDAGIFRTYLKEHFLKHIPKREPGEHLLLILDGHRSHLSPDLLDWAVSHDTILLILPAHTSHILQPLDISCHAPFEEIFNSYCQIHTNDISAPVTKYIVCQLACKAYVKAMSIENLFSGFYKSGIHPFDRTVVNIDIYPTEEIQKDDKIES